MEYIGYLTSLRHEPSDPVNYYAEFNHTPVSLNQHLGEEIEIAFLDEKACCHCGRKIKKTYNNGYCYKCLIQLPENDLCIVKPELCHYHKGTCRDSRFGDRHCMQPHIVYLALSSDVKVGITRKTNMLKRWIDQGAVRAIPFLEVPARKTAGEIEVYLARFIKDKTNWRKMLKNETADHDLFQIKADLLDQLPSEYKKYLIEEPELHEFRYPHITTPEKITSLSLDKQSVIKGKLTGIKAQYLILDTGVFHVRKHTGYKVAFRL
ncbi:DUF2797 domain-containing protein [Paenactinomyces guangxiensis]|uniref:DUF2797 domain-containing protein n=1 Tax=Paenactinomyces guangxiensis TaxID=1490290 RepID=A0A7W2A933_9BACL|nr:DUF2797 domain-containing protein [Paenactinomyces guangxiensis]MBA4494809.1 DUF2797 domain-containing protein [Paenactinomyces guangxiensis]MBH8591892.1 DUF2797 domain-containing protein [Paenactinomyces guangxiensis]